MSSLLPVVIQPPRARTSAPPEPRATPSPREGFARSLETARRDAPRPAAEDAAVAKAHELRQQRAQLQSLMLSGAMKFAGTRHDVRPDTAMLPGLAYSLPATPSDDTTGAQPGDGEAMDDATFVISPIAIPEPAQSDVAAELEHVIPTVDAAGAAPAQPATGNDTAVSGLPEYASHTADAGKQEPDDSAARQAALQLIAVLPFEIPPVSLPDSPAVPDEDSDELSIRSSERMRLDGFVASLPDVPQLDDPSRLLEDHFDASAPSLAAPKPTAQATPAPVATGAPLPASMQAPTADRTSDDPAESVPGTRAVAGEPRPVPIAERNAVERDISQLDPAFRERLERVIARMQSEFGHQVTVVETVRSQSRQNTLFAQGRSVPGPVVTWTRHSMHTKGLAADLVVDGAWKNPLGYAHLAAVAREEGLRTLGARDPGHVELPTEGGVSAETLHTLLGDLQGEAGDGARQARAEVKPEDATESRAATMARIANVAQVARVATVASVAKVATVARPGGASRATTERADTLSPLAVSNTAPPAGVTELAGSARVIAPTTGVNMADRISHLMDLQATQAARPLSSVLLRMENASGIEDQIRIDTRGTSVDARLGLGNAQQAAALTDRLGELREALERRGLTAESVRVQATAGTRTTDSAAAARGTAPIMELSAMRAASDSQAQSNARDQSSRDQQREAFARDSSRHTPRSSSDDTRHRSRREQPEDRR